MKEKAYAISAVLITALIVILVITWVLKSNLSIWIDLIVGIIALLGSVTIRDAD